MLTPCNACHYYHFKCLREGACKHASSHSYQQQQASDSAMNPVASAPIEHRSTFQMGGSRQLTNSVQPVVG